MPHFDQTVLQAIPEPALIAVRGRVSCFNAAAADLFPELTENGALPAALPSQAHGAGTLLTGGRTWRFTASPVGEGTLFLLHVTRLDGLSHAQLDGIVRRLREQMSELLLSVQLMDHSVDRQNECRDRLAGMTRTLCRMLRMTDRLDLLRDLDSDLSRFTPATLDLAGLCREVYQTSTYLLEQAGVTLCYDSAITSLLVNGDGELLEKLLLELIVNAARAAGKGGTVTLSLFRRERRAVVSLSGPGKDDGRPLPQLLSGDGSADRIPHPGEGAGTGLSLAQRIVSLHEGTLMMERREGLRTIIALPLAGKDEHIPFRTPGTDYDGGFSPALVALSDLLPERVFAHLDEE